MKITSFLLFSVFWLFIAKINAQYPPAIQWQKLLGGSNDDGANAIQQTMDKGYIIAGYSKSNDGNLPGGSNPTHRSIMWVIKTDTIGNIKWQKQIVSAFGNYAVSIQQTTDSGYIVASVDSFGGYNNSFDYRVTKLNSTGVVQWAWSFGGTRDDRASDIKQTSDGGYIIAGYTMSNDTDVSGNHGNADYWIVKLNSSGVKQWQKCLGGSGYDYATSIQLTSDGGYIVAGYSSSNDGDVSGHHATPPNFGSTFFDYWIVKLNSSGNVQWQKSLGGTWNDYANTIQQTRDGGYIVSGYTESNNGDVTVNHDTIGNPIGYSYYADYWVVKLDSLGNLKWQKSLGGRWDEKATSILQDIDGGYVIAGKAKSRDGDVGSYHSLGYDYDGWIVKLDSIGSLRWKEILDGVYSAYDDDIKSIKQTIDGGYILAGSSTLNNGSSDVWVVKLSPTFFACPKSYSLIRDTICSGTPYNFNGVTLIQQGTYRDTLINANSIGCDSIILLSLVVKPAPSVSSITGVSSICASATTTFSDGTTGGTWSSGNTNIATVNANGIVTGVAAGTATINYTVISSSNGCSGTAAKTITVNSPPVASISQSNDTLYCSVTVPGATYKWFRNGSLYYTSTAYSYLKITSTGNYTVQINSNGCFSTSSTFIVSTITAIWNNTSTTINAFMLYPNPASQMINISIQSKQNNTGQLRIFNIKGKEEYSQSLPITKGQNLHQIDISHFAKGIYIIRLEDTNGNVTNKFVIE